MPSQTRLATVLLSILSLLSAFLLFQVQPMISKFILPWFGGSPGVWTTCMLFFQIVLFLGYAYAHGLMQLPRRWQMIVHGTLVIVALAMLPIAPGAGWKPTGNEEPVGRILLLLLASVALPYFVLSSTSPLVQVWFSRATKHGSPWRLYALSNIGSLAALLSYPVFFEIHWDVLEQTRLWSWTFLLFAALSLGSAVRDWKYSPRPTLDETATAEPDVKPKWWQRLLWVALPAFASMILLATTNHVCQDVAVIPFLWVAPLSLYLITFIICFEHERWYKPALWALPALVFIFLASGHEDMSEWLRGIKWLPLGWLADLVRNFKTQLAICFGAMFFACMVCHGELTRIKPASKHLTEFYLLMSAGGAIGGLLVSLAAPQVFTTYLEWPLGLVACFLIAGLVVLRSWLKLIKSSVAGRIIRLLGGVAIMATLVYSMMSMYLWGFTVEPREERVRNFYGAVSVEKTEDEEFGGDYLQFHHGSIVHGTQSLAPDWRETPLSYYSHDSGIGHALDSLVKNPEARVGIVGMGTATTAAYGKKGQTYRYYDINPDIVRIAQTHFTYVQDFKRRGGIVEIVLGDARLNLEREPSQQFDVLLLDAFSGDSVPVHLLTAEAFQIYRRHMKPNGIIAVHVSNRYLELAPVVQKVIESAHYKWTRIVTEAESPYEFTDYILATNDEAFLKANPPDTKGYEKNLDVTLWTDLRHNLYQILEK